MVKGWADHSSSEEEEEEQYEHSTAFVEHDIPVDAGQGTAQPTHQPQIRFHPPNNQYEAAVEERTYEYPTEPPYTAFVGNLAFSVTDVPMFVDAMSKLVSEQLQVNIKFISGKIISDPQSNPTRHRGFGYIEVETVEDLQKLMELNKCQHPFIAGRRITVDTSTQKGGSNNRSHDRRRPSNASNNGSHHNTHNNRRNSSRSITSTHSDAASEGPKFRGGRQHNNIGDRHSEPPLTTNDAPLSASSSQRPVLTLKPRSKPVGGEGQSGSVGNDAASSRLGGSSSSIFGAAKPRDEQSWTSHKEANTTPTTTSETDATSTNNTDQDNRPSMSSSQHQQQPRDVKSSGRSSGAGRTGIRGGRGGLDGNNRGGGRAYSGRGNDNTIAGVQSKYNKNKGSDGAPETTVAGKKGHKKPVVTATPVLPAAPPKPIEPEKKAPAKPANTFAALALDDSDSD